MSYCCTYDITDKDNNISEITKQSCFSEHYHIFKEFKSLKYYIFKDYEKLNTNEWDTYDDSNKAIDFTENELKKYVEILNRFGAKIKLNINDVHPSIKEECWSFTLPIKNIFIFKVTINMLRYLHENEENKSKICKGLLIINKELKQLNVLNKIILAHYFASGYIAQGHALFQTLMPVKLFTNKEYKDKIKEYSKSKELKTTLNGEFKFVTNKDFKQNEFNKLINDEGIKKAYYYYKKLLKNK